MPWKKMNNNEDYDTVMIHKQQLSLWKSVLDKAQPIFAATIVQGDLPAAICYLAQIQAGSHDA